MTARRAVIVVTHLLGVGHLARARLLAGGLAANGFVVMLASGGAPVPEPADFLCRWLQLPPVHIAGTAFGHLLDAAGAPASEALRAERRTMLVEAVTRFCPDVLVTEHFPFGRRQLAAEFIDAITAARAANPAVLVVGSVRDVLVAPSRVERIGEANDRINALFDAVLVHGDEHVLPLDASWPDIAPIRPRLRYTGYIAPPQPAGPAIARGDSVLVSGGGSPAALPLLRCAIAAAHVSTGRHWRILAGHAVAADDVEALMQAARSGPAADRIHVERARPDFAVLLAGCGLSVSMAGYNTMLDLVRAGTPAVVVPFDAGQETEQTLRADAWARAGMAQVLKADALTPAALLDAMARAQAHPATAAPTLRLDGVGKSVEIIRALLREKNGRPASGR